MNARFSMLTLLAVLLVAAVGCQSIGGYNLPPAERLMHPGPGVDGPGPSVLAPVRPCAAMMAPTQQSVSQVLFAKPEGMQVRWDVTGIGQFDSVPLICPGRHNFPQGGIYRLKLTNIPGREGEELYPTIEIGPTTPRTEAFLAHNAIPIQLTEEDFDQVLTGNFVTKVIYLPDPEYQELALAGVETLVSTRLDPGVDPVVEADRRGAILAILRLGNIDPEMPGANGEPGGIIQASFTRTGAVCRRRHCGAPITVPGMPPSHVSGVTSPSFGMPMSGTPIGLVGPSHIPHGVPAGLKKHVMKNHTHVCLPDPTKKVKIHVKQHPGMSYPKPPDRVRILEQTIAPAPQYRQPRGNMYQFVPSGASRR